MEQRYKTQTKFIDNNDYVIYNPLSMNWSTFDWEQGYFKHYVTYDEIYKFYLIPFNYYGTTDYADVILLLNNIATEFDLYPGAEIKIPKYDEIKQFIYDNQKE
jgi:hypothetical protein